MKEFNSKYLLARDLGLHKRNDYATETKYPSSLRDPCLPHQHDVHIVITAMTPPFLD